MSKLEENKKRIEELELTINKMLSKGKLFSEKEMISLDSLYSEMELLKLSFIGEELEKDGN